MFNWNRVVSSTNFNYFPVRVNILQLQIVATRNEGLPVSERLYRVHDWLISLRCHHLPLQTCSERIDGAATSATVADEGCRLLFDQTRLPKPRIQITIWTG